MDRHGLRQSVPPDVQGPSIFIDRPEDQQQIHAQTDRPGPVPSHGLTGTLPVQECNVASTHDIDVGPSPDRAKSASSGHIFPETVACTLRLTFDDSQRQRLITEEYINIRVNDPDAYASIEKTSYDCVWQKSGLEDASQQLIFTYGSCTIAAEADQAIYKQGIDLMTQSDLKEILKDYLRYWSQGQKIRLLIDRAYIFSGLKVSDGDFDLSLTEIVKNELNGRMRQTLDQKWYIDQADLKGLIGTDTVKRKIEQDLAPRMESREIDAFTTVVRSKAPILLAISIMAGLRMACLNALLDRGLHDGDLPLQQEHICHKTRCSATFQDVINKQWSFMAARFDDEGCHQEFSPLAVIPIHYFPMDGESSNFLAGKKSYLTFPGEVLGDKGPSRCGHGAFSSVYRVRIHHSHHKLSANRDAYFALKEFTQRPKHVEKHFRQELQTLEELRTDYPHEHVVTHLATWTQESKYCMLFPYADCNMREYMQHHKFDAASGIQMIWILRQLRGLASAIKHIHDLSNNGTRTGSRLHVSEQVNRAGWHHDIKPQNILYFAGSSENEAAFRIADLGSSKIQTYRSGSIETKTPTGTPTYEPPEAAKGLTSRPYDIWSLGCVFLELLIWAVQGHHAVEEFRELRKATKCPESLADSAIDDCYWQITVTGEPYRRKSVDTRINKLRTIIIEKSLKPFGEVLNLIEQMLDPIKDSRITALNAWDTLERICQQESLDLNLVPRHGRTISSGSATPAMRLSLNTPNRRSPEPSPSRRLSGSRPGFAENLTTSPTASRSPGAHNQFNC